MSSINRIPNRDSELLQATVAFPSQSSVVKQLASLCIDVLARLCPCPHSPHILALRDGSTTVSIRVSVPTLTVEVADDGRGIPRDRLETLSTRREVAPESFLSASIQNRQGDTLSDLSIIKF